MLFSEPPITTPPVWLDPFYKKCIMVEGLPIVSSDKVDDKALREAYRLAVIMLKPVPDATKQMVTNKVRIAIMDETEVTLDIPEHSDLQKVFPETDWNKRARGLGATKERPCISAAEENLLRRDTDRYKGESIFIHEFSHAIMDMGLAESDPKFMPTLTAIYEDAKKKKLWENTYAQTNVHEYWAESVQSFFDANRTKEKPDGVHNHVGTPEALKAYDPEVYKLIEATFGKPAYDWQKDSLLPKS
jgi:alpha-glucosidase